nr:class I SAM-dependent methyltransferase [uncultured Pseudodesulfovibrio sp.]
MRNKEKQLYPNQFLYWVNQILLPIKLIIPQTIIEKIPFLLTNFDIRAGLVILEAHGKILDVGCGENQMIKRYKNKGGEGMGVDVYPWDGIDLHIEDSAQLPFDDKSFDTVSFVACINHIPNRAHALKEARRVLADDGTVVITNLPPFISKIWHFFAFWDKDLHERGMIEGEEWGFSKQEMFDLIEQASLQVNTFYRFSFLLNEIYVCKKK